MVGGFSAASECQSVKPQASIRKLGAISADGAQLLVKVAQQRAELLLGHREPGRLDPPLGSPPFPVDEFPLTEPQQVGRVVGAVGGTDRKSTRLSSSHSGT